MTPLYQRLQSRTARNEVSDSAFEFPTAQHSRHDRLDFYLARQQMKCLARPQMKLWYVVTFRQNVGSISDLFVLWRDVAKPQSPPCEVSIALCDLDYFSVIPQESLDISRHDSYCLVAYIDAFQSIHEMAID